MPVEYGGSFGRLAVEIHRTKRETISDVALAVKREFEAGPPRSGVPRGTVFKGFRRPWSVRYDIRGVGNPTALVKYRGPVHWTDRGTGRHAISPRGAGGSRRSRQMAVLGAMASRYRGGRGTASFGSASGRGGRALSITGIGARAWAMHPGARARPFFRTVVRRSVDTGADKHRQVTRAAITRAFSRAL